MKQESIMCFALRLKPGEDLRQSIESFVKDKEIRAGWVVTALGSLARYCIRFANQADGSDGTGHFEIISLSGTVSINGSHLHICISDKNGHTLGGHLLKGCLIYTTAEIILQATSKYEFMREKDETTSWNELRVKDL